MNRAGWFFQMLLAGLLSFGTLILAMIVMGIVAMIVDIVFPSYDRRTDLRFDRDGNPFLMRVVRASQESATDLDGNPIETPEGFTEGTNAQLEPVEWSGRLQSFDSEPRAGYWYMMYRPDETGAWLVGYDPTSRQRIGFIGIAGFSLEIPPQNQRFTARLWSPTWQVGHEQPEADDTDTAPAAGFARAAGAPDIAEDIFYSAAAFADDSTLVALSGSKVFGVDLHTRQARVIFENPDGAIRNFNLAFAHQTSRLLVRTDDALYLLDHSGRQQKFSLPEAIVNLPLEVARRADGGLTVAAKRPLVQTLAGSEEQASQPADFGSQVGNARARPLAVYVLTAHGTVTGPRDLLLDYPSSGLYGLSVCALLLASPSLELLTCWPFEEEWQSQSANYDSHGQFVRTELWRQRWWLAAATALGALLAVLCWRRQSRFRLSWGQRIFWPLYVFLLGLPGWVGYRYSRRWAPLEACERCHAPSPRNNEMCAACNREFPLPAVKGTEIFA